MQRRLNARMTLVLISCFQFADTLESWRIADKRRRRTEKEELIGRRQDQ